MRGDWEEESSQMASIYENAFITIAANRQDDGLLSPRTGKLVRVCIDGFEHQNDFVFVREAIDHGPFYLKKVGNEGETSFTERQHPSPARARCFQERLSATRILHFTEDEALFECKTGFYV
ncbi:hypothetical protein B0O99DRAFT_606259 [Bisporella sp. PMI_857]|nr:hypothetical protein B0O99DRAFT_606259 [Bisporella sp. PMI_857]